VIDSVTVALPNLGEIRFAKHVAGTLAFERTPAQLTVTSGLESEGYQAPTRTQVPSTSGSVCIAYLAPFRELRELGTALSPA
jgi:hypothetical protein